MKPPMKGGFFTALNERGGDHESQERSHHAYTWDADGNNVSVDGSKHRKFKGNSKSRVQVSRSQPSEERQRTAGLGEGPTSGLDTPGTVC